MDLEAILARYDKEQRIEIEPPGTRREMDDEVVRLIDLSAHRSCILHSRLAEERINGVVQREIDRFETLGHDFEWKVYSHDTPADLKDRLLARGFLAEETEAIMALDLKARPRPPGVSSRSDAHEVRRITDPGEVSDATQVNARVWNQDVSWLNQRLACDLEKAPDQISVYVAYVDGKPVSSAWMYFTPRGQFASLWGGSTLPEWRRRGLYSALLNSRITEAKQRGIRYLTIDAMPMSRPIATRRGFKVLTYATGCVWKVSRSSCPPSGADASE